jgi:hypothetical protein
LPANNLLHTTQTDKPHPPKKPKPAKQRYAPFGASGADAVFDAGRAAEPGATAPLPGQAGYNQIFEQVFQAYEPRVGRDGVMELVRRGAVEPVRYCCGWLLCCMIVY